MSISQQNKEQASKFLYFLGLAEVEIEATEQWKKNSPSLFFFFLPRLSELNWAQIFFLSMSHWVSSVVLQEKDQCVGCFSDFNLRRYSMSTVSKLQSFTC